MNKKNLSKLELEQGSIFAPNYNEKGLVSAIAIDAKTNEILMLAHMNSEAISLTLETKIAHYFSRSRNKIWKKGETSGETQKLIEIRVDCDQDALLLFVEPQGLGAACHTGRKSCFFRKVETNGDKVKLKTIGGDPLFDPKKTY
jgi:phosphoribosyl-AMP cyclohydrolase